MAKRRPDAPPPKRKEAPFHAPFAALQERAKREAAEKAAAEKAAAEEAKKQAAAEAKAQKAALAAQKVRAPAPAPVPVFRDDLSDEELFRSAVEGARALPETERVAPPKPPPQVREVPSSEEVESLARLADLCAGSGPFDLADTVEYIEGSAPGVDHRLVRRLRKGEFSVQAHLDLHGLTREEAKAAVEPFINRCRAQGLRCVLIVHGRGLGSKDHIPVLKQSVGVWLQRGRLAKSVLCFATARPHDGGAGAVYVLLRR